MALTLLTDSYDSLANIDSYWTDRLNTSWTDLSDSKKESYIRQATDYIDRNFEFIGQKKTNEQRLKWPRLYAVDNDGYTVGDTDAPWQVKEATAIMADLYRQGTYDLNGIVTKDYAVKREKIDVIEIEYDSDIRQQGADIVNHVYQLLSGLIASSRLLRS